jgi:lipopolysaccharide transport system ATP-binding protein
MSSDPVVVVEHLSKVYQPGLTPFQRLVHGLTRRPAPGEGGRWALRDVSFELERGETLGIMGRNGCGKSTLLEIISGTLTPTSGRVAVRGKLAALLELGAGFSPELTGRENVFVYGALLGMSKAEITTRFDEIADFAELGSYMDQPVKFYSSGMFVRLAFAVAISSAPPILVIDEALAVGDEAFQRRCFARIESLKQSGVSLLFVSHAAGTVLELCDRALLLDDGELILGGPPRDVVRHYHRLIYAPVAEQPAIREEIRRDAAARPTSGAPAADPPDAGTVRTLEPERHDPGLVSKSRLEYAPRGARIREPMIGSKIDGEPCNVLRRGATYRIEFEVVFDQDAFGVRFGMLVKTVVGTELGGIASAPPGQGIEYVARGTMLRVSLPFTVRLAPDTYFANVGVVGIAEEGETFLHRITDALAFRVANEQGSTVTGSVDFSTPEPVDLRPATRSGP